jgi:hypothetical protein
MKRMLFSLLETIQDEKPADQSPVQETKHVQVSLDRSHQR